MQIYQLFKAFTATADAGAQLQIIKAGTIVGIQWSVLADLDADGEDFTVEASLVPIYQSNTNDAKGVLSSVRAQASIGAAGAIVCAINKFFPMQVPVGAGQLLYLNAILGTTADVQAQAIISVR